MDFDFGMIGLGTMGRNLLLNLADHGASVAGLDLDQTKVDALKSEGAGKPVHGFTDAAEFVASIRKPRAIMMLVPAGAPVDSVIKSLSPHIEKGDLLIDGGNSFFKDTDRRYQELATQGIGFFGMGVSGGEEGARHGPSMMAGGPAEFYDRVRDLLNRIAAKAEDGSPCVDLLGKGAAGHYIKMVHNGIEYAIMQMLAEVYDVLHRGAGLSNDAIADEFGKLSSSPVAGFLIEITETVLRKKENGVSLVDLVKDAAKQKGTGKWTSQEAMDLGVAIPSIDAAVASRYISALRDERLKVEAVAKPSRGQLVPSIKDHLGDALHVAITLAYAQGLEMLRVANDTYHFDIQVPRVAAVWRAGCIIRSKLLSEITRVSTASPNLSNLILDPTIAATLMSKRPALEAFVAQGLLNGYPVASLAASLSYLDAYTTGRLPANLTQAQRDFFGAHTFERLDKPGSFHENWEA